MPQLITPTTRVRTSFLAAMAEFQAEGRGRDDDDGMIGHEIRTFGATWSTQEGFAAYAEQLAAQALEETPRPAQHVPCTTLWWIEGDEYLGRIAIRHRLTESLLHSGGHIGYDVRASARRRGHATAMLAAALPVARGLGIERALLTCHATNVASKRVIEHAGGALEDQRGALLRFWLPTSA